MLPTLTRSFVGTLASTVQAVEQRSTDPAASLAQYFTLLSKRNGEVTRIVARRTLNRYGLTVPVLG